MEKEVWYGTGTDNYKTTFNVDGSMKIEGAIFAIKEPSQLERMEKKMDRILELLKDKELSTSVVLDGKKIANVKLNQA